MDRILYLNVFKGVVYSDYPYVLGLFWSEIGPKNCMVGRMMYSGPFLEMKSKIFQKMAPIWKKPDIRAFSLSTINGHDGKY